MLSKIIINSPWYFFLASFAFAAAVALWLYFRNKKNSEASNNVLRGMFALRFLSISFITLLVLNIFFRTIQNETENPVLLIAIDNSSSISAGSDSVALRSGFIPALKNFTEDLKEKYTVRTLLFGADVKNTSETPAFREKETDIDNLMREVENNYSNQNIGALIIATDGVYNKGANPIYSAEKLGFPVYSIALGDTNEIRDISIQKVNHNEVVYAGNLFPVEVLINSKKFQGKEVEVTLLQNGKVQGKQSLKINSENFISTATFSLSAETPGLLRYTAQVTVLSEEKNVLNNRQSFVVEVIDNKEKILILAGAPHPDVAAIREALAGSPNYEIEFANYTDVRKPLKAYSLVILQAYSNLYNGVITECRSNQVPFWIINPTAAENIPGIRITGTLGKHNDAEPYVNKTFGLFNVSDELRKFANDLPPVKTFFGNYTLSNSANSLLNQRLGTIETENPILFYSEADGQKSGVFIGEGLWRWRLRDYSEHKNHNLFNELISKSVQYLSVKSDKSFFRLNAPKIINENTTLEINAEVYNKSYELVTDPEVTLVLTNEENKKFNYTFSKASNSYKLNVGLLPPGEYRYEAKVKSDKELLVKQGFVAVKEVVSEKINTVANHRLLYQLSKRSNGDLYYPNQLEKLKQEILNSESIKPVTYSQSATSPLIDFKWLFFLILLILAIEWFFRKRYLAI